MPGASKRVSGGWLKATTEAAGLFARPVEFIEAGAGVSQRVSERVPIPDIHEEKAGHNHWQVRNAPARKDPIATRRRQQRKPQRNQEPALDRRTEFVQAGRQRSQVVETAGGSEHVPHRWHDEKQPRQPHSGLDDADRGQRQNQQAGVEVIRRHIRWSLKPPEMAPSQSGRTSVMRDPGCSTPSMTVEEPAARVEWAASSMAGQ